MKRLHEGIGELRRAGRRLSGALWRLWSRRLRYHRGKIIGVGMGLLLGLRLFGLLFGLIAGSLVDAIIRHMDLERGVAGADLRSGCAWTGRIAGAALLAIITAGAAKAEHLGIEAAGHAGDEPPAGGPSLTAAALDAQELELVKRQVMRAFALSPTGMQVVRAVSAEGGYGEKLDRLIGSGLTFTDPAEQFALMQSLFEAASVFGPVTGRLSALAGRIAEATGISPEIERITYLIHAKRDLVSYRLLGVDPDAPLSEIRRVYRSLAVQFHPDSLGSLEPEQRRTAEEAFIKIREAYESIMRERSPEEEHHRRDRNPA